MDLGFETIGNATVICHDRVPVLATDPWLTGSPYFGSWILSHRIPQQQLEAIQAARFLFISHGHPDHLNPESLALLPDKEILVGDHYGARGGRIARELRESGRRLRVLKDGEWTQLSERISVACIVDINQDSMLFIRIGDDLIIDANDATDRGCGAFLRQAVANARRSYLLWLTGYGDADMINFFDEQGNRVLPAAAAKELVGPTIAMVLDLFGIDCFAPSSSMHRYQRTDSAWANEYITPISAHGEGFESETAELLPAFVRCDLLSGDISRIDPPENSHELEAPEKFGDDWSEVLDADDVRLLSNYFGAVTHLKRWLGYVNFRVGGRDHVIDLNRGAFDLGITFEAPRNSLMTSVRFNIFDDMLIGNFMKTTLHGNWNKSGAAALYPDFTPFVSKYADNGEARTEAELKAYFRAYTSRGFTSFGPGPDQQAAREALSRYMT